MTTSFHTPRQRGLPTPRPSFGGSPNFSASVSSASVNTNRNASLRALNGQTHDPRTPGNRDASDLVVGDEVNVPGDMYGVVKFLGAVKGKNGTFVGVELDPAFANKGKNDGDVEGTRYFTTSIPGAGIFLPVHRAEKRSSPTLPLDAFPGTPDTPTYSTVNGTRTTTRPTPTSKFAQTVGPGARPPSPSFKPKRPSLPRPESPFRKPAPNLAPTPGRNAFSQSQIGGRTPAKSSNFKSSTTTRPPPAGHTPRPYSRSSSRMGNSVIDEDRTPVGASTRNTSNGSVPSFSQAMRSPSRLGSAGGQEQEIQRLKKELAERDRRLDEQAASLAEMDQSVQELSAILPADAQDANGEGQSVAQLRQMLREKNEKISLLTAEFDAHRADFRSTLDSLEMASTETERVYEEQKRDLLAQLAELQDLQQSKEDFDGVAMQLKGLEDLVAELEEGLEESRRGEAEARGEVEFLRGEVERGRSELKRERDKAAATAKRGSGDNGGNRNSAALEKEMEKKDDEIRGLKAIVHGLSSRSGGEETGGNDEGIKGVQQQLEANRKEKEALEEEIEHLRREVAGAKNGTSDISTSHTRNESERTATAPERSLPGRTRGETIKPTNGAAKIPSPSIPDTNTETTGDTPDVYCEMCEASDHDTLDCTKLRSTEKTPRAAQGEVFGRGKENEHEGAVNGSGKGKIEEGEGPQTSEEDKWCALCEKEGHLAFDCPEEQY
ncbi:hypothetical protein BDY17DRAFT_308756 [Neohortaea acidophila]|uniref:CAP-Gly domain-containing protein n=1 Tax=Neohortaea acidophila TaxID=245834 RepID=A0A6A6PZB1_9PEZI|nr:uncharacterized protein BDY17DRAFT_308756 [Neohortaea acidophila]KAF2485355.1 hypothetical protein BDY17DRAFT_308756 [Neohortaea acidophila]